MKHPASDPDGSPRLGAAPGRQPARPQSARRSRRPRLGLARHPPRRGGRRPRHRHRPPPGVRRTVLRGADDRRAVPRQLRRRRWRSGSPLLLSARAPRRPLGDAAVVLVTAAGIGLAAVSLAMLIISEHGTLFGFHEPGYDPTAISRSRFAEIVAIALLTRLARAARARNGATALVSQGTTTDHPQPAERRLRHQGEQPHEAIARTRDHHRSRRARPGRLRLDDDASTTSAGRGRCRQHTEHVRGVVGGDIDPTVDLVQIDGLRSGARRLPRPGALRLRRGSSTRTSSAPTPARSSGSRWTPDPRAHRRPGCDRPRHCRAPRRHHAGHLRRSPPVHVHPGRCWRGDRRGLLRHVRRPALHLARRRRRRERGRHPATSPGTDDSGDVADYPGY